MSPVIRTSNRSVKLPASFNLIAIDVTCPSCDYDGSASWKGSVPDHFPGFDVRELVFVYHSIVGAARDPVERTFLLIDSDKFHIDDVEPAVVTEIICGHCRHAFAAPHFTPAPVAPTNPTRRTNGYGSETA